MIGALWTGISGLSSQQKALDNESNNIANVNTVGYKSSRISFADQMYQSKIGKGSIVQDAEKLFVQGNTKITGVEYDMMLEGDGFFTVINKNSLGTAETFYTRAGNFRMGDNGTLQDAGGNEVQGWIMSPIDATKDVTSSNPNTSVFTNEYTKMLGSKIVRHGTYVETITAKATDYNTTAKTDSLTVFSGDGAKSKSSKVSDIEEAIKDYNSWLQKLKEEPDAISANSIAQISQVDFKSGKDSIIGKDGDAVYVVINGEKISQKFITTTTTEEQRDELWDKFQGDKTEEGLVAPIKPKPGPTATPAEIEAYNKMLAGYEKAFGKIETYKALADSISNKYPVEATMAIDSTKNGTFNIDTAYQESTKMEDMLYGIIQIKSLIPGQEFKITEVGEESSGRTSIGNYQTTAAAVKGSGIGAVEASKDALSKLVTGKQQDVYTPSDLGLTKDSLGNLSVKTPDLKFSINVYDKELGRNIPIPNNNDVPLEVRPLLTLPTLAVDGYGKLNIDDIVDEINKDQDLSKYIEARNVNGNLVIQTKDSNYDVKFVGNLQDKVTDNPIEVNKDYSGREGAGAEFLEIVTTVDQTSSKGSIQLRLDTLNISDSPFGEFSVDSTGLITMKQDGAEFAIGQVSIARFNNNRGLEPQGNNLFAKTSESGDPIYNINNNKMADVRGKALELSNADLSESLVNLMIFQRAFEANAKSITTSDELLNTLINLKR